MFVVVALLSTLGSLAVGQAAEPDANTEWFVFVATGLPQPTTNGMKEELVRLIQLQGQPGDRLHFIATPAHDVLASFVIPALPPGRGRLRNREVQEAFQRMGEFFRSSPAVGDTAAQLQVPLLPATFWALRRSAGPVRIVLAGDPIYTDIRESFWSMRGGRYHSDASLSAPDSTSPFHNPARKPLPADAQISWLIPNPQWGDSKRHREHVTRFYRLAFQTQLGGKLVRMTSSPETAFNPTLDGGFNGLVQPDNQSLVGVWVLPDPSAAMVPLPDPADRQRP